jgi:hypothetical protein
LPFQAFFCRRFRLSLVLKEFHGLPEHVLFICFNAVMMKHGEVGKMACHPEERRVTVTMTMTYATTRKKTGASLPGQESRKGFLRTGTTLSRHESPPTRTGREISVCKGTGIDIESKTHNLPDYVHLAFMPDYVDFMLKI